MNRRQFLQALGTIAGLPAARCFGARSFAPRPSHDLTPQASKTLQPAERLEDLKSLDNPVTRQSIYPADAYSRPAFDRLQTFQTLSGCAVEGDVRTRAINFEECELRLLPSPQPSPGGRGSSASVTEWRLRPKPNVTSWSLALDEPIRRKAEAISFRVRNLGSQPLKLQMQIGELPWEPGRNCQAPPWLLGQAQDLPPGEEKVLTFQLAEAFWPNRKDPAEPRYPVYPRIFLIGLQPGELHSLHFSELTVIYPLSLRERDLRAAWAEELGEATITPGKQATFLFHLKGTPEGASIDLELRRENLILWRIRLTDEEQAQLQKAEATITRLVPWYLSPGPAALGVVAGGYRVAGQELALKIKPRKDTPSPAFPKMERREHNGRPTLFKNGQPFHWQGYASVDFQPGNVNQFGASGTNVFCPHVNAGRGIHHSASLPTWIAPDRWDFSELHEKVGIALQANPEAFICFRVSLALPAFWWQKYPDELVRVDTDQDRLVWEEENTTKVGSLASEQWRKDQAAALRKFIRYCKKRPWAERVIGFFLMNEVTEEWFAWGCNDGFYADYSGPNEERFGQWLNLAAKASGPKRAPRSTGIPFAQDSALTPALPGPASGEREHIIPPPSLRSCPNHDIYPESNRLAAAYHQYYSDLTAETIAYFAKVVKEETDGRSLAGAFYGYLIQLAGEPRQALGGNFAVKKLLDSPHIDFLAGIPLHDFRKYTEGYDPYISATESIQAAGKLYLNENDLFSWIHPLHWYTEYDPKNPRQGAIQMHRRECANDAIHGTLSQKFSLFSTWHYDAELQRDFAFQKQIAAKALSLDRTPVEEIAFAVDERSFAWTPPESKLLHDAHKELLYHLGRTGAPIGVWLLSDLDRLPKRIKFIVVAGCTSALPDEIDKLSSILKKGGKTVLVVGPAGLVDPLAGKWRPDRPAKVLGLPIGVDGKGLAAPEEVSRALPNNGQLIWRSLPPLSTSQLRQWAEQAGVHLYAPQDYFVHASRELVSVTAPAAGTAGLRWPQPVAVRDLFDGWQGEGQSISCPFFPGQTRLFKVDA